MRRWVHDTRATLALVPTGLAALFLLAATLVAAVLSVAVIGLPALDATLAAARRRTARRHLHTTPPSSGPGPASGVGRWPGSPPYGLGPGGRPPSRLGARLRWRLGDHATWRVLAWQAVHGVGVLPVATLVVLLWCAVAGGVAAPLLFALSQDGARPILNGWRVDDMTTAWTMAGAGVLLAVAAFWLQRGLLAVEAALARALLRPTARAVLADRVAELAQTRTYAIDAQAMELRRIERDLHDGAQAQLTALTMNLGLAEKFLSDDERAKSLVAEARASAGAALEGLRDIVRGIHPPVLAERGLAGGVRELVLGAGLPVEARIDLPDRPPAPVESALYFTAAELLTNASRHAAATRAELDVSLSGGMLRLTVRDDGRGGAEVRPGGGLDGLRRRLAPFDGQLDVDSPRGGPTVIEVTVPCGS